MKKLFLISFFIFTSLGIQKLFAQRSLVNSENKNIHFGFNKIDNWIGVTINFDYQINQYYSTGLGGNFRFKEDSNLYVFGRVNFHLRKFFKSIPKIDPYIGSNLGITKNGIYPYMHLGCRYFIFEDLGLFLEIGNHGAFGIVLNL